MHGLRASLPVLLALGFAPAWAAPPIRVVAAEAVYAQLVRDLAGPAAAVTAILDNPAADPHLFEAVPTTARALTNASLVIYNGANYDPWMRPLLAATASSDQLRRVIDVADLVQAGSGANPHLWYNPQTMPALAAAAAAALITADPPGAPAITQRLAAVRASLAGLAVRIALVRARHAGQAVTATEPGFGPMLAALGLEDRNQSFQRAIMNGTEPSAAELAAIEADLRTHRVRALIHNSQTDDPGTRRLLGIARSAGIPVVAISETEPPGLSYTAWVGGELDALDRALGPRPTPGFPEPPAHPT